LNAQVVGNVAQGTTDSGNGVKVAGVYKATPGSVTDGQRVDWTMSQNGTGRVYLASPSTTSFVNVAGWGDNTTFAGGSVLFTGSLAGLFDGTNYDRQVSIAASAGLTNGLGVSAVAIPATNNAGQSVSSSKTTVAASSLVLCSAACNLYNSTVTSGAVAGYMLVFNAISAPANGVVTPEFCRAVAANSTVELDFGILPRRLSTGATIMFSSTGCYSLTASATAAIEGVGVQ
jgi:hypothetical protein